MEQRFLKRNNKSQIKMGVVYLIANVLNKAIAFITIPVFSRLLTMGDYGTVSTYSAYVTIIYFFMGMASEYTVRNAYVDYKEDIYQYMSAMFLLCSFVSIIVSCVIVVLNAFCFHISNTFICICCVIQSFMTYINAAVANKYMMEQDYINRAIITAAPNLCSVVLGILFILLLENNRAEGRILGYVIGISVFGIFNLFSTWRKSQPCINRKYIKFILSLSPPLIIHGLSVVALSQLDRIMLTSLRNSSETGVYSIIYSLSMVAMAVTSAIEGIWIPWFTNKYIEGEYKEINKRAGRILLLTAVLMFEIMLAAPEVLKFMTPSTYWTGMNLIPPLVASCFFMYMYSFSSGLELFEKKTKQIAVITMFAAGINIILNYILIPVFGALAASCTTLFSYFLSFLLHYLNARKINKEVFLSKIYFIPIIILLIGTIIFYIYLNYILLRWLVIIISLAVLGYIICKYPLYFY